jgi:hypothetical protein
VQKGNSILNNNNNNKLIQVVALTPRPVRGRLDKFGFGISRIPTLHC